MDSKERTEKAKRSQRIIRFAITALIIAVLAGLYAIWTPFSLVKDHDREETYTLPPKEKQQIGQETENLSAEEVLDYSIRKTARMLSFRCKNDIDNGKANCVGYAKLCAAISNHAYTTHHINAKAKPVVGYVKFYSINVCQALVCSKMPKGWNDFFKDHDFVEFQIAGQTIYADPSLYDLTWKDCKTYKTTKTKTKTK